MEHRNYLSRLVSVFLAFLKLGVTSFGGPAAHLGYFRHEFVIKRHWFSESEYAQLVAIAQFLPGPASSQVGFAIGLLRAGWLGALIAFISFTLPSVLIMLLVAATLITVDSALAVHFISALKLVACVIVSDAVIGMFRQFCMSVSKAILALLAFTALMIFTSNITMFVVLAMAALIGMVSPKSHAVESSNNWQLPLNHNVAYILLAVFVTLFILSFYISSQAVSLSSIFANFYQTGSLVFGGGHVVLPLLEAQWVANDVITRADFMSGYGAAQILPGPLFSFAAYLGVLIPNVNQTLATIMAITGIFLPGFLLMTIALSLWTKIAGFKALGGAITAVNAAVVGVLASVLIDPVLLTGIQDIKDILIAVFAVILLQTKKLPMVWVILLTLMCSLVISLVF